MKWLNAYAEINELAAQKICKKFTKDFFEESRGKIIKKDLAQFVQTKQFSHRQLLEDAIDSLYKFFVVTMADGDESRARQLLESQNLDIRKADAV